jgi:hypothetical protein
MKTKTFFIILTTTFLFTGMNIDAQVKLGLHGGLNLETQAELGLLWNNVDLYQGFTFGGFLEYETGKKLSFQTELNYQKKGEKIESTSEGINTVTRREFDYVTVPVLLKGNFHPEKAGENWNFTLFTGPYVGYLTSVYSNSKSGGSTTYLNLNNQAEKTDWGVIFGGGVSYKLGNGSAIVADLRYQMGLNKVDKGNPDLRNKGAGIVLGYRF